MEQKQNGQGSEGREKEGSVEENPPFGMVMGVPHEETGPAWGNKNCPCPQIEGSGRRSVRVYPGRIDPIRGIEERARPSLGGAGIDLDNLVS
jgi:hypothetical protein